MCTWTDTYTHTQIGKHYRECPVTYSQIVTRLLQWINMKTWSNYLIMRKQMLFIYVCIEKKFLIFLRQNIFFLRFYWQDTNTMLILWIKNCFTYHRKSSENLQNPFSWAVYLNISWAPHVPNSVCELRQTQRTPSSSEYRSPNWSEPSRVGCLMYLGFIWESKYLPLVLIYHYHKEENSQERLWK